MAPSSGYHHPGYARALAELGVPRALPASGGWLLERPIGRDGMRDLTGCYPLFACGRWDRLEEDLAELPPELVSVTLVADPFGAHDARMLARCFPERCVPFKRHFVADLTRPGGAIASPHHRRNIRRASRTVEVERCARPVDQLDAWVSLYGNLIRRHGIEGVAAFSRESFAAQLAVPGIVALRAVRGGDTVGMTLWYQQGDVAYYHLGAYSDAGYEAGAAFALFAEAFTHFRGAVHWLALGAGAGLRADDGDGLSRFKRGWATGTRVAYLCGRVLDPRRYAALVRAAGAEGEEDFFPAYRSPHPRAAARSAT
ncbi:MAG TPA: GNAT family N-acetyltransferase [Gemmatimonadales bacterium]